MVGRPHVLLPERLGKIAMVLNWVVAGDVAALKIVSGTRLGLPIKEPHN